MARLPLATTQRFWSRVEKTDTCWLWIGRVDTDGYGRFPRRGATRLAHRTAYEIVRGEIPYGKTLDHLCRVRHCVNPEHLEAVDNRTNVLRGDGLSAQNARKTHCKRGHEFEGKNLAIRPNGDRRCRTCDRDEARERMRRVRSGVSA